MSEKKRSKLADAVEVLIPKGKDSSGRTVFEPGIIPRGDMTDEEWAKTKRVVGEIGGGLSSRQLDASNPEDELPFSESPSPKKSAPPVLLGGGSTAKGITPLERVEIPGERAERMRAENPTQVLSEPVDIGGGITEETRDMTTAERASAALAPDSGVPVEDLGGGITAEVTDIPAMERIGSAGREAIGTVKGVVGEILDPGQPGQVMADPRGVPGMTPTDALRKAGSEMLGRSPGAQLAEIQKTAIQPGEDIGLGRQPPAAGQPAGAQAPGATSMRMSASGGPARTGTPATSEYDKALKEGQDALRMQADAETQAAQQRIAARASVLQKQEALAAEEKAAQTRIREAEDKLNSAYQQTLGEMTQKMKLDPSHMWNSRTDGQKALMVVGAFLAGIGGRDPAGMINQLIQRDLSVQRENFEMAREAGKMKLAGIDSLYGKMRQRGLDEREAFAAARAAMTEGFAMQLGNIADSIVDKTAKAKAGLAVSELRMNVAKAKDDAATAAAQRAHMRNQDELRRFELGIKAAKAADEKNGIQATLAKEVQGLYDALASVRQMKADGGGGFFSRLKISASELPGPKVLGALGVKPIAEAGGTQANFRARAFQMMTELARGALQKPELEALSKIIPQEIKAGEDPVPFLEKVESFVQEQIRRREEAYGGATPDIRGESAGGQGGGR